MSTNGAPLLDDLQDLKFRQYKLFTETAEKNSDRRASTQRFYTTIHTSLLTLLAFVAGYSLFQLTSGGKDDSSSKGFLAQAQSPIVISLCALGVALCVLWSLHLRAYRKLNSAKFTVINQMEDELPLKPFKNEWTILTGEGTEKKKRYIGLTALERSVPALAVALYLAFGLIYLAVTEHWQLPNP